MKFLISYECRTGDNLFTNSFEFQAERELNEADQAVIEAALEDSLRFCRSGQGGLFIKSVELIEK